ncbi:TRAF3-interacting JNK-activating modulator [Spea bombifrons]|uniref:TRAF3-interacting JNK-activating modulator n=1 Tax=Spea bombifrons TaxID=233779 RepID=UPI00234AB3BE|nr:TRAF3-interacting JNK-activating modulator [Spea bombifrons]XP_053313564.1 TRAF3-interacting JNK-activating modulator [Spea bombifrons]XP_053313565.1 TRAF3-interacting JNK-activating modulator [Spea bombifrons]
MASKTSKSPVGHRHLQESFEDKHERRLEFHEILRSRYNITSCRQNSFIREREQESLGPFLRQQEFFRRRQLNAECDTDMKSPQRSPKYNKYSPLRKNFGRREQIKDQGSASTFQSPWHHWHSKTHPQNANNIQLDVLQNSYSWGPLCNRICKQKVSTRERGDQTEGDTSKYCIKKETSQQTDCSATVLNGELMELSEYLTEALQRERKLKKKLAVLQELLNLLVQASEKSWKVQLNDDKLKCKISNLENQLFLYSKNIPRTHVKKILLEMEDQKCTYEEKAKESLQKLAEEKMEADKDLQNTKMSLMMSWDECDLWKEEYKRMKEDWSKLTSKNCELRNELQVVQSKLKWLEVQDSQVQTLQNHLQSAEREGIDLQAYNDQLQEDNELLKMQLDSMEGELRNMEMQKLLLQQKICDQQSEIVSISQRSCPNCIHDMKIRPVDQTSNEQSDQLCLVTKKLEAKEKECDIMKTEMESLTMEYRACKDTLQQCRENLKGIPVQQSKGHISCWVPVLILFFAGLTMFIISAHIECVTR